MAPVAPFDDLRAEVRAWCRATIPADWRTTQRGVNHHDYVTFQKWWISEMVSAGYFVPHWPQKWGGVEMSLPEQVVLYEELSRCGAPRTGLTQVAVYNAAPALMHAGTEAQKQRFLPSIAQGEVWCQGFSEPNAGSDLASMQTRAVRDGDHFVVSGQKLWTSSASEAERCILLARTNSDVSNTRGISFFVMDMRSPGIELRRIKNAVGGSEFFEMFLDEVRIPVGDLIGGENNGWTVSQSTLGSERAVSLIALAELLRTNGRDFFIESAGAWRMPDGSPVLEDPHFREVIGGLYGEVEILRLLLTRLVTNLLEHGGAGPEASVVKIFYTELLQRMMKVAAECQGLPAQLLQPELASSGWETHDFARDFIHSYSWTIAGGTNEIMRNVVGEQVLGLAREPRPQGLSQ